MSHIFIANSKGGCGKTTIAAQLVGYGAKAGKSALLMDHDSQKSGSDWLRSRPEACPKIHLQVADVGTRISSDNYDLVVHDMPAAWSLVANPVMVCSGDKLLIPVLPSPTDIKACLHFLMALQRAGIMEFGIDIALIANRVRSNTRYFKVLTEFLERLDLPLISSLRDTQNYVRSMDSGLSIFDLPASRVKRDLEMWEPILEWTHIKPH